MHPPGLNEVALYIKFALQNEYSYSNVTCAIVSVLAFSYFVYSLLLWRALVARMPPGPTGFLWFGNRHQVPAIKPWRKFAEWSRHYGKFL